MEPIALAERLRAATERLLRTAFPDVGDLTSLDEVDVVPLLATMARQQCAAGEAEMCQVMRSWLWDGIVTMLMDTGVEVGGPDYEQAYTDFVSGDDLQADGGL